MESSKYIKSFDYIRVVALLGVFLYHLISIYVPSGYLGVVVFFELAGFLTMKQLIDDDKTDKSVKIGFNKITNKIMKLYPALLVTVIVVTIIMVLHFKNFLISYPVDAISSIFSINNYAQILKNESYFEAMNSIKPLTHIWALSLEFQFYILFYILVFPFYKKENSKKFRNIFLILTLVSFAIAVYLVKKDANLTRIYYSIDSRLATFLIGVLSAMYADSFYEFVKKIPQFVRFLLIVMAFLMIYAMIINFTGTAGIIGIIIVYSLFTGVMLLLLYANNKFAIKNNKVSELCSKVSTIIVKRSYVIYLIHYPIIVFANRFLAHMHVDLKLYFIILIFIIIAISEIIYRVVNVIFNNRINNKIIITSFMLLILISSIIIRVKVGTIDKSKDLNDTTWLTETTKEETNTESISTVSEIIEKISDEDELIDKEKEIKGIYNAEGRLLVTEEELNTYQVQTVFNRIKSVNALVGGDATLTRDEFLEFRNMKITFIGDSVTQGSKGSLSVYFPNAIIDAEGNRQLRKALPIFYDLKEKNQLGDVLVVALGTNSDTDIRVDVLEEIYQNMGDRVMIILTVAIPYLVEEQKRNKALRGFAETHDNCHIADWYSTMKTHKEYFVGDDTHPQGLGTDVYAQLIFKTAIQSLEWRKVGNEWQYFGSDNKMKLAVELEKNIGDTVEFGSYYISGTEKEKIEWVVIDKDEEKKTEVLISKKALDRKKYANVYASTIWQKSELRRWLNEEFYGVAFDGVGAKFIMTSALDNHKNDNYKTTEANVTYDRVFVPSFDEINKYKSRFDLHCEGSEFFKAVGGYVNESGNVDWWLRTAGDADNHVMYVSSDGEIMTKGDYVTTDDFGVRPMIKVTYK